MSVLWPVWLAQLPNPIEVERSCLSFFGKNGEAIHAWQSGQCEKEPTPFISSNTLRALTPGHEIVS
jgi:hypothetical protein